METHRLKLKNFSGPLDLLLELIEGRKMEITDVSLIEIADDFLGLVKKDEANLTDLSEFLLITSHLIFLKSKALLPKVDEIDDQQEELDLLKERLKVYRLFKMTTDWLGGRLSDSSNCLYERDVLEVSLTKENSASDIKVDKMDLKNLLVELDEKNNQSEKFHEEMRQIQYKRIEMKSISLKEKVERLSKFILEKKEMCFNDYIKQQDEAHVITNFLALIELLKKGEVVVSQKSVFDNILVKMNE